MADNLMDYVWGLLILLGLFFGAALVIDRKSHDGILSRNNVRRAWNGRYEPLQDSCVMWLEGDAKSEYAKAIKVINDIRKVEATAGPLKSLEERWEYFDRAASRLEASCKTESGSSIYGIDAKYYRSYADHLRFLLERNNS